jgi:hypothetical protein
MPIKGGLDERHKRKSELLEKMGLTNAERQSLWRARHPEEAHRRRWIARQQEVYDILHQPRLARDSSHAKPKRHQATNGAFYSREMRHTLPKMLQIQTERSLKPTSTSVIPHLHIQHKLRIRHTSGNHTETLVKFKGLSDKHNRWLSDAELAQYQ